MNGFIFDTIIRLFNSTFNWNTQIGFSISWNGLKLNGQKYELYLTIWKASAWIRDNKKVLPHHISIYIRVWDEKGMFKKSYIHQF